MFRIVIPALLLAIQYMLYRKARRWISTSFPGRKWAVLTLTLLFLLFNAMIVAAAIVQPSLLQLPQWALLVFVYPFFIWHGAVFFVGLVLLLLFLVKLPFRIGMFFARRIHPVRERIESIQESRPFRQFDASRRVFLRRSMEGLTALSFAGNAYGLAIGRNCYDINKAEFVIPNLDPALDGFSIALVSDIHSSAFMTRQQMDECVREVNALRADLIVVPGDFVNSMVDEVYPFAESFANLKAPLGVYGVMGNHDFYTRDPELVAKEVDGCGVRLLRDDKTIIEKNGAKLYLVGVDDVGRSWTGNVRLDQAIGSAPLPIPRILLCHRPYYLEEAATRKIDLVLSGHTHGGQIVFAQFGGMTLAPAALASRYIWGPYRVDQTQMYVSRGIGTVGIPVRLNCPPEITRIVLKTGPAGART